MKSGILETLSLRPLIADGGIGTELQRLGLEPGACGESWNLEHPEKIDLVHRSYVEAGADLITTNTFRGNRVALSYYGLERRVNEINRSAASLAQVAAGDMAWVMGSVGPLGGFLAPLGDISIDEAFDAFAEQVKALREGGVDAIIIETMTAVDELELAIRAARAAGSRLVVATMAFDKVKGGYKTMMGVSPAQMIKAAAGADVIGCNCGAQLEMGDYIEIVRQIRSQSDRPIIAQPNAGQPELVSGQIVYGQTPEAMSASVETMVHAGASIVGGCCGTTPAHIRSFAAQLRRPGKLDHEAKTNSH